MSVSAEEFIAGEDGGGKTYVIAVAGMANTGGVAADDDVGVERVASAVDAVGDGAGDGAVGVGGDLGRGQRGRSGENEGSDRLHFVVLRKVTVGDGDVYFLDREDKSCVVYVELLHLSKRKTRKGRKRSKKKPNDGVVLRSFLCKRAFVQVDDG